MTKITFVGAGSWGFTRKLARDILTFPLTAAVLSLSKLKQVVNEMFQHNREYLPQFKHVQV